MGQSCSKTSQVAEVKPIPNSQDLTLKQQQAYLLKWIEFLPSNCLLFMLNVDTLSIIWNNQTVTECLGYTKEDLFLKSFESLLARTEQTKLLQAMNTLRNSLSSEEEKPEELPNAIHSESKFNLRSSSTHSDTERKEDKFVKESKKYKVTLGHKSKSGKIVCECSFEIWAREQLVLVTCNRDKRAELRREGSKRLVKFANEVEVIFYVIFFIF